MPWVAPGLLSEINNVPVADSAILRIIQPDFDPKNEAVIFPSEAGDPIQQNITFEAPNCG